MRAFRSLLGCGLGLFVWGAFAAEEKLALIPDDVSLLGGSLLWDKDISVRTGFGYKDNVLWSPFHPQGSPFLANGLEVMVIRLPADGLLFSFFLDGNDTRYLRSVGVDKEQTLMSVAQVKKDFWDNWQLGAALQYSYVDQVQDLSLTESQLASAQVQGHGITFRPSLRRNLTTNWWVQLEVPVTRQLLSAPLDNFWQIGPKLTLCRELGRVSELRLSYAAFHIGYDHRAETDAAGNDIPGTRLERWTHKVELAWQRSWDEARHWRTTTTLGFDDSVDNAAGYFDYRRYGVAEELRYQAGTWDIRAKADVSYYDFPVRTISTSDVTLFNKWNLSLRLRAEKRLASFLKVYAEYEHERSLSNEDFEKYSVNTVLGGLQWEF